MPIRYHQKYFREDAYGAIRNDISWQRRIIGREDEIWGRWKKKILYYQNQWFNHVFKRTDPGEVASTPETYGEFVYYSKQVKYPDLTSDVKEASHYQKLESEVKLQSKLQGQSQNEAQQMVSKLQRLDAETNKADENLVSKTYDVYMRHRADTLREDSAEVVLDLAEVPFIRRGDLRGSTIDKIKMSDDHSLLAFTVDVGNTEVLVGGIKNIAE